MKGKSFWAGVAALAAGLIFVTGGGAATSTTVTLTVNSTTDSNTACTIASHKSTGTCSLRGAIDAANAYQQDNTTFVIKLAATTYHLTLGQLDIAAASSTTGNLVQVIGATAGKKKAPASTIDGSGNAKPNSVVEVDSPTQMFNLVITGGTGNTSDSGQGGGLYVTAALDLENSIVQHNTACSAWTGSSCTGNYADGGGIFLTAGLGGTKGSGGGGLTLYKTTMTHNTGGNGGGIASNENNSDNGNAVLIMSSHIDKNTACDTFSNSVCVGDGDGGGIWNDGEMITLDRSTVNGNIAGSRAYGSGDGGGIDQSNDAMQLNHTVVSGNVAGERGGGIYDDEHLDLVNSTVSHNGAGYEGGGIDVSYVFTSENSTVSGNTAGGTFACTVNGSTTTCQSTTKTTSGTCASLYPSATDCTYYDGYGGGVFADYEYPQFIGTTVTKNLAVSITGDSTDCSSTDDYHGGQGGGVWTAWAMTAIQGSKFTNNTAACGGGIYQAVYEAEIYGAELANSTISGNTALRDGGGVWTYTSGSITLYGMKIMKNHAGRQTGGVWDQGVGDVLLGVGNKVTKNTSTGACKNLTFPCK